MKPFLTFALLCTTLSASAAKPWPEILGPSQGSIPPGRESLDLPIDILTLRTVTAKTNVKWEEDLTTALRLARQENRPIFVTLRCLPCRTCSEFDKTVLEGGPDLDPLFRQFIPVRLTNTRDIDLRLLPMQQFQDMDLSWWSWFLSPEGRIYGVFGGRDHLSDTTRTSKPALINAMKRVLAHHYDPRRPTWDIDGPKPTLEGKPNRPIDQPGFESWLNHRDKREIYTAQNCIHCHQAAEIFYQSAIDARTFDKSRDLDVWPLPENVGITLDRDHGLLIKRIDPDSPAARAGLKPNDVLAAADGRKLFSQADFRGVLHRGPRADGAIDLWWTRDGKPINAPLHVKDGWRRTILAWRVSVGEGPVGAALPFWPLDANRKRDRLGIPPNTMAVEAYNPTATGNALTAGLKHGDVIVAVNGESPHLVGRPWSVWFKLKYNPGDPITLTVQDAPRRTRDVTYITD